jgi:hypothetical protein
MNVVHFRLIQQLFYREKTMLVTSAAAARKKVANPMSLGVQLQKLLSAPQSLTTENLRDQLQLPHEYESLRQEVHSTIG